MPSPQRYMTDQQIYSVVTAIVFAFVALAHIWRIYTGAEITANGTAVPLWISYVGLIVSGAFAIFGIWLACEKPPRSRDMP